MVRFAIIGSSCLFIRQSWSNMKPPALAVLQCTNGNDESNLDECEVDDPLFCAADCAEVSVLASPEVLLVSRYRR